MIQPIASPSRRLRCLVLSAAGASSGDPPTTHDHFNHCVVVTTALELFVSIIHCSVSHYRRRQREDRVQPVNWSCTSFSQSLDTICRLSHHISRDVTSWDDRGRTDRQQRRPTANIPSIDHAAAATGRKSSPSDRHGRGKSTRQYLLVIASSVKWSYPRRCRATCRQQAARTFPYLPTPRAVTVQLPERHWTNGVELTYDSKYVWQSDCINWIINLQSGIFLLHHIATCVGLSLSPNITQ